jgi:hypothetical protein
MVKKMSLPERALASFFSRKERSFSLLVLRLLTAMVLIDEIILMEEEDHYAYRNRSCCNPDSRV